MRRAFADELYKCMEKDPDIWVISVDLGYKLWDQIRDDYPDRFLNTGAAEQAAMGIAVGLALEGKKPFIYSITPFLLYRPFETIRNYVSHEKIPVRLVGGGRGRDYAHDGWSHDASDDRKTIEACFPYIGRIWPTNADQIADCVFHMVNNNEPVYINLKR